MGALPPVDPSPDNSLRILDREPALPSLHKDDHGHHEYHEDDQEQDGDDTHLSYTKQFVGAGHGIGHSCNDSRKDDQRDTVPNSPFRNLLAQPHDEGRASGQGDDGQDSEGPSRSQDDHLSGRPSHILQTDSDSESLDHAEDNCSITGILDDFLAAHLPFFLELGEIGDDHREELKDNRCADVRHDAESKDREPLERSP